MSKSFNNCHLRKSLRKTQLRLLTSTTENFGQFFWHITEGTSKNRKS